MKHFDFELKRADTDAGTFSGYASVFGNVDLGGDVVMPGAFQEFVRTPAGEVVALWQHDPRQPIGTAAIEQDDKGLRVAGKLVMADPRAQMAREHMKAKSVTGMSIGYDVLPGGAAFADGVRRLTRLKLWEVSLVTFPMNPLARVSAAKSALACRSISELEDLLREALVLPARKAKRLASATWPILSGNDPAPTAQDLAGRFEAITKTMKGV